MRPVVGQTAQRSLTLTEAHVKSFAELTGDYNPLHFDEAFAKATRFGGLVVQGGLTTGLLHALVAMDLPGPGSVFLSQQWKFTAPGGGIVLLDTGRLILDGDGDVIFEVGPHQRQNGDVARFCASFDATS